MKDSNTCWRIVRTNEDGSIRLVYYGVGDEDKHCTESSPVFIGDGEYNPYDPDSSRIMFNSLNKNVKYVGYMFSTYGSSYYITDGGSLCNAGCSSAIKIRLETWYELNLANVESFIADGIFCSNHESRMSGGTVSFFRSSANTYKCTIELDRLRLYKYGKSGGSMAAGTALYRPIGLLTAPDIYFAGGGINVPNTSYYLSYIKDAWTMTPYSYDDVEGAKVMTIGNDGRVVPKRVNESAFVYPVISLKPTVKVLGGSGLAVYPYVIGKSDGVNDDGE